MIYLLIILLISQSIRLSVHMQLVSLLQWHLFSMQWSTRSHRSTHQWFWSYIHVQLVSLLQWRAQSQSLQWVSRSVSLLQWHQSIVDLFAELVDSLLVSLLQWHQSIVDLFAEQVDSFLHSESATIDISILHKTKKIHSCKHESLKRKDTVTILATHLCW